MDRLGGISHDDHLSDGTCDGPTNILRAVRDVSVTNFSNAACGYSDDEMPVSPAPLSGSPKRHSLSLASLAFALFGFAIVLWLLRENDYRAVLHTVISIGGGLAIIVAIRAAIVAIRGFAWWRLMRNLVTVGVCWPVAFRTIGESINVLLPTATVGGDIVRAMLLKSRGVNAGLAIASTLVDLLLQAAALASFALVGAALLRHVNGGGELAFWLARAIGVAALVLCAFYAAQRFGGARLVERGLNVLARRWPVTTALRLEESLDRVHANWRAITTSFSLHELAWLIGALETSVALRLMGMPVSLSAALILESLNQTLRAVAFPLPGALGVQEGSYVALGAFLGIPAETALALSFVKRVPDLVIGLPGLLGWYLLQLRRTAAPAGSAMVFRQPRRCARAPACSATRETPVAPAPSGAAGSLAQMPARPPDRHGAPGRHRTRWHNSDAEEDQSKKT